MKRLFVLLLSLCAVPSAANAQNPAKNLPQLLRSSFTVPETVVKAGLLNTNQLHMLNAHFSALEETRRALYQDPAWILSEKFDETAAQLQLLNLPLPPRPKTDASTAEKEYYLKRVNDLLYRESKVLAEILGKKARPRVSSQRFKWKEQTPEQLQAITHENWEQLLAQGKPEFSWGVPNWNEVQVKPFSLLTDWRNPSHIDPEIWEAICLEFTENKQTLYEGILENPYLTTRQQQMLISATEEASAVLTYDFVQLYVAAFSHLPRIKYLSAPIPNFHKGLETYAITLQKKLILKLEEEGSWNNDDFENFAQASVYLPPAKAKAVLGAVTFLMPQTAIWLLEHPLENAVSQKIIKKTKEARSKQNVLWPDGTILPKANAHINFSRLRYERQKALESYSDILWQRLQALMDKKEFTQKAAKILEDHPLPQASSSDEKSENLSNKIFVAAREARLDKTIKEIHLYLLQADEELAQLTEQ